MKDEAFWQRAREQMMRDPASINFNSGTLSQTPKPVFDAVTDLRRRQAANPSDFHWRVLPGKINESRKRLAEYLNCSPSDLVLLPNVTFAMNIVIASLRFAAGSEILTTDHEYGAMRLCLERAARKSGWVVREIVLPYRSESPQEIVDAFAAAINSKTSAIFFSHGTTTTGLILPAKQIARLARERGDILVIGDGAHAPGMIPLDLADIDADFYGANCHKWMMAPAGAGFLHVAPRHKAMIEPLITSWGWGFDRAVQDQDSGWGGSFWQRDLEFHGTLDRCPQMVIPEALDFREWLGGDDAIIARYREITDYARHKLAAAGLTCVNPHNESLTGCILAFDFPCDDLIRMRDTMWNEFKIECPVTTAAGKTFLRVSCAWFNTREEIDRLTNAVGTILSRR